MIPDHSADRFSQSMVTDLRDREYSIQVINWYVVTSCGCTPTHRYLYSITTY